MAEISLAMPRGITRTLIWFSQRGITLTSAWMEEKNFCWPRCLPSTLSIANLPKKLSLLKSTSELRKCDENSTLKICSNIMTSIWTSTSFFWPMLLKHFVKRASLLDYGLVSRSLLYSTRIHIRCVSQIYRIGIGPVYWQWKVLFLLRTLFAAELAL